MNANNFKTVVEQDRMELLLRYPFYGRVICQCELVPVHSTNAPVACNDCRRIYLSETAYMALPADDRLLVLAHEVLHITLRHAFRCGSRNEDRFSFAADAEIYPLLRNGFPQQDMDDYDENWNGLTAEEIYELLPKKLPETPPMHCYPFNMSSDDGHADMKNMDHSSDDNIPRDDSGNAAGSESDVDDTYGKNSDDHKSENEAQGESNGSDEDNGQDDGEDGDGQDGDGGNSGGNGQGDSQGQGNSNGDGNGQDDGGNGGCNGGQGAGNGKGQVNGEGQVNGDDQGQGVGQSEGDSSGNRQRGNANKNATDTEPGSATDAEDGDICEKSCKKAEPAFDADTEMFCRQLSAEAELALKAMSGRGNDPGNLLRLLEKINTSHIDWKSLLRQFIREVRGGSYRWLPPNRRFISKGLYLPGRRQKMFRGVVALDTSGSTVVDLPDFVGEVERLMRSFGKFELTVIECDAAVGNVTVVSSDTKPYDWWEHHFSGGGGTDFTPVFDYIQRKRLTPDVLMFFTDGNGACPEGRPRYPVLWLLTEYGEPPVSWGIPVKMEGDKNG